MTVRHTSGVRLIAACLLSCSLAGSALAQSAAPEEESAGSKLMNILRYGGPTVPPEAPQTLDAAYCPPIDVPEGGAAIQASGGRSQITLGQVARECTPRADGSVSVKLGIEGRALLGPSGAPGRFEAPIFIAIKRNGAVVASRARRVAVTIPSGSAQGAFAIVEDGVVVPAAAAKDYDIEVGLGGGARTPKAPRRQKAGSAQPG